MLSLSEKEKASKHHSLARVSERKGSAVKWGGLSVKFLVFALFWWKTRRRAKIAYHFGQV